MDSVVVTPTMLQTGFLFKYAALLTTTRSNMPVRIQIEMPDSHRS